MITLGHSKERLYQNCFVGRKISFHSETQLCTYRIVFAMQSIRIFQILPQTQSKIIALHLNLGYLVFLCETAMLKNQDFL